MAIKLGKDSSGQRIIGVAVADLGKRNFRVGEFPDDGHLANLQTLAVQLSPRELLVLPVIIFFFKSYISDSQNLFIYFDLFFLIRWIKEKCPWF